MTITIAVTGGIGAGKSRVAARLAHLGAVVIDSDVLAREVVAPGTPGLAAVVSAFGAGVIDIDGVLQRAALAAIVFSDPAARARLNAILHPLVRARFASLAAAAPATAIVVNDIPLLVDLAMTAHFHLVVGVHAEVAVRIERLVGRGLDRADAQARIAAQIDDADREQLCDVWLANDGPPELLTAAVDELWTARLVPFRDNVSAGRAAPASPLSWNDAAVPRWCARVSRAVEGAAVQLRPDGALVVTAPDPAAADRWQQELRLAGFPPRPGADLQFGHADPGFPITVVLHTDPGSPRTA